MKKGPPRFMRFWELSDVLATHPPDLLTPSTDKGTFLPRPSLIWGAEGKDGKRKLTMVETLTAVWKLLVLRPCLFRRGDLDADQAYLGSQDWRDMLNRASSDTVLSAMWRSGKPELWGMRLQPSVVQHVQSITGEPTLKKMDCPLFCSPFGKFNDQNDPRHELAHLMLFRLVELHVLHDFASYHPDLQREIQGRWCPPPFDAQDALDDRPSAFPGLNVEVSDVEKKAMDDILSIVRWNGVEGQRAWEMEDGESYRNWLTAFRNLLSICPDAWENNPSLWWSKDPNPEVDVRTCDLHQPDAPIKRVTRLVMGTHMLLAMRAGRVPWLWFYKPALNHLECKHDTI